MLAFFPRCAKFRAFLCRCNNGHNIVGLFLCFFKFFFCSKWNGELLLVIKTVYTSCLTSCRGTLDFKKPVRFRKTAKTVWNYSVAPALPPKIKISQYYWKITKNSTLNFSFDALFYMKSKVCFK